jgi:hypothetical protein
MIRKELVSRRQPNFASVVDVVSCLFFEDKKSQIDNQNIIDSI